MSYYKLVVILKECSSSIEIKPLFLAYYGIMKYSFMETKQEIETQSHTVYIQYCAKLLGTLDF